MRARRRKVFRAKLYLLLLGAVFLGALLTRAKSVPTGSEEQAQTEGEPSRAEEAQPDTDGEAADAGDEAEPLPYTGMIRVLLKTDGFAGEIHETVKLSSVSGEDLQVCIAAAEEESADGSAGTDESADAAEEEVFASGNELHFAWEDGVLFLNGEPLAEAPVCLVVRSAASQEMAKSAAVQGAEEEAISAEDAGQEAQIRVDSLTRTCGVPAYEGSLEVWPVEDGFLLVNEVPLETYLRYVVPSEMPAGYEAEALKAQAVCARTYAYKELSSYAYPACRAHVDDSVSFQVYGNAGIAASTDSAVAETAGQILTYAGSPITAYYFSTSCGATGNEDLWWKGDSAQTPWLTGKLVEPSGETADLSEEEVFADFLAQTDTDAYEADAIWYRWETEVDTETLSENLNSALASRYAANPEAILTKTGRGYQKRTIRTIGKIQGIDVLERNPGGAVTKVQIRGSRRTIRVYTEYNVRALLNAQGCAIEKNDGTSAAGTALLPSACVIITPVFDAAGDLTAFHFSGGGYGHGAGLSQNGANRMAKQGQGFQEILQFFYTGVELTAITDL